MKMRVIAAVLALLSIGLAGCGSDGGSQSEPELSVDEDVEVTADTGAIRGVVVDGAVAPIAGAQVMLREHELTTTTNDAGEFVFSKLEPGTYFIDVRKSGFGKVQTSTEVVAGEDKPPVVKVLMERVAGLEPAGFARQWDGVIQCSVRYVVNARALCATGGALGDDFAERYTDLDEPPTFVQSEMVWENTQRLGESLKLEYTDDSSGLDNYRIHQGASPLVINADNATLEEKNFDDVGLLIRVFTGSYQDTGVSVTVQQTFSVFTSFYYNYAPPEGWMYIDGNAVHPAPE